VPLDPESCLGNGGEQGLLVDIVQLVTLVQVSAYAAADYQHGDTVEKGFPNAAAGMCDTGGRNDNQGANVVGASTDCVGHEAAAHFVGDQYGFYALRGGKLIVNFDVVNTGNPESEANANLLQGVAK
jgi:hypothetical protein